MLPADAIPDQITYLDRQGQGLPDSNILQGSWPDRCFTRITRPQIHTFTPAQAPMARALVYAGGGYHQLVYDKEGVEIARWLNTLGIEAHVLVHRLPGQDDGAGGVWPYQIARNDGMLALDLLAENPPLPLLHVGLSSGGHLAGVMSCQPHALRACGLLVAYGPINANHRDHKAPAGKPDYPPPQKQAFYDDWPIGIAQLPHGMPPVPVFLAYGLHDTIVPVDHALNLIKSMQVSGGQVDAHIFASAPHGFALRERQGTHSQWPQLAANWMAERIQEARGGSAAPA